MTESKMKFHNFIFSFVYTKIVVAFQERVFSVISKFYAYFAFNER